MHNLPCTIHFTITRFTVRGYFHTFGQSSADKQRVTRNGSIASAEYN
jgi:hypothetical protein